MSSETNGARRTNILVCSDDNGAVETISKTLSSLAYYEHSVMPLATIAKRSKVKPEQFDIAIFDIGDGDILSSDGFRSARETFNRLPILFISNELNQDQIRQLMKLDGADWLKKPIQSRSLIETITSIGNQRKSNANKVHAIVPCGGGSGATLVSIMLAHYWSRKLKRKRPSAAIFDLDFTGASVGAYLNIVNDFRLEEVVGSPERVDLEFIEFIKKSHESGFSVFSFESPGFPASAEGSELILRMLDLISFQHDHTVVDFPSMETPWRKHILKAVDTVTIVTGVAVPSLQRAKQTVRQIQSLRGNADHLRVVVNRSKHGFLGMGTGAKKIAKVFDGTPLTFLPDEKNTMLDALNRGVLPNEVDRGSKFCKRLQKYAEKIQGELQ